MTVPRLVAMSSYWERWPPVHKLVAMYMGIKPKEEKPKQLSEGELEAFIALGKMANANSNG